MERRKWVRQKIKERGQMSKVYVANWKLWKLIIWQETMKAYNLVAKELHVWIYAYRDLLWRSGGGLNWRRGTKLSGGKAANKLEVENGFKN